MRRVSRHSRTSVLDCVVFKGEFDPEDANFAVALAHPDPCSRMYTLVWRSWMHAGLGNYRAQITDLRAALALVREYPGKIENYTLGRALYSLARMAGELGDFEAADDAREVFESIEWPAELAEEQYFACAP